MAPGSCLRPKAAAEGLACDLAGRLSRCCPVGEGGQGPGVHVAEGWTPQVFLCL